MGRRLSHTQREMYEQCPYKYNLRYNLKYKTSLISSALCFGNALDAALNELLIGNDGYHEVFDSEWSKYKNETIDYYDSDLDLALLDEAEKRLDKSHQFYLSLGKKGHLLLDAYYTEIMPRIVEVISIQDEMTIVGYDEQGNETEDSIYGKLDLIALIEDGDKQIRKAVLDNKTTSAPYSKNSVKTKDQLALYAQAYPDIEWFGYLTLNKKNFKTQVIVDQITQERKDEVIEKFITTLNNINEKRFEKNTKSCYAFGRRCEYWTHCHKGFFSEHIYQESKEK